MPDARRILHVGLTGGIASGKTTVAGILAGHGAFVVDADELAHEVIAPGGPAYDSVLRVRNRNPRRKRSIDRKSLGKQVFRDVGAREALNAIVHLAIRAEYERRLEEFVPRGDAPIAVFDAALLVETGRHKEFQRLVVTRCDRQTQIRRLVERDNLPEEEARARLESQLPLEDKLAVADYIIDTGGTLHQTRRQTDDVYARLVADFELEVGPPQP